MLRKYFSAQFDIQFFIDACCLLDLNDIIVLAQVNSVFRSFVSSIDWIAHGKQKQGVDFFTLQRQFHYCTIASAKQEEIIKLNNIVEFGNSDYSIDASAGLGGPGIGTGNGVSNKEMEEASIRILRHAPAGIASFLLLYYVFKQYNPSISFMTDLLCMFAAILSTKPLELQNIYTISEIKHEKLEEIMLHANKFNTESKYKLQRNNRKTLSDSASYSKPFFMHHNLLQQFLINSTEEKPEIQNTK